MKKFKVFFVFVLMCGIISIAGCGEKQLPSANITRDEARTGGSLSFVYDKNQRKVFVGGQDEIVQYSTADENLGIDEGCRIGLKVSAPDEKLDFEKAILEMNGVKYTSDQFLQKINEDWQRFFYIYPIVSKEDSEIAFIVRWAEGTKEQNYKIYIVEGTKFMDKDGNIK